MKQTIPQRRALHDLSSQQSSDEHDPAPPFTRFAIWVDAHPEARENLIAVAICIVFWVAVFFIISWEP